MTKSSLDWILRLPALASAGCGLENLRNGYRRVRGLLEGFFEKKMLAWGQPREIKGLRAVYWRQKLGDGQGLAWVL